MGRILRILAIIGHMDIFSFTVIYDLEYIGHLIIWIM